MKIIHHLPTSLTHAKLEYMYIFERHMAESCMDAEMWETAPSFTLIRITVGVGLGMTVGGGHQSKLLQVEETQERWQRGLNSRLRSLYLIELSL